MPPSLAALRSPVQEDGRLTLTAPIPTAARVDLLARVAALRSSLSDHATARTAAAAALDQINDGVWFAVIAGSHEAKLAYPYGRELGMVRMDPQTRAQAKAAVAGFQADGGTAMGTWLTLATRVLASVPSAVQRHAILLTDGINQHETPEQLTAAIEGARGRFQADCRGVGAAWQVAEVRRIATALLGTVDLIARPEDMAADFEGIMRQAMGLNLDGPEVGKEG